MTQRVALSLIVIGALSALGAYVLAFAGVSLAPPWMLAAGATLILTGMGLLGAGERSPRLSASVIVACALTFAGFAVALGAAPPPADGPLLLGLPRVTALMLVLTGAVPLVLLPIAYAWAFPREVMPQAAPDE